MATRYDFGCQEIKEGKGEKDGHCNRTACQAPLKGKVQWFMDRPFTTGYRLYYCTECARDFSEWDLRSGDPLRCQVDETTLLTDGVPGANDPDYMT